MSMTVEQFLRLCRWWTAARLMLAAVLIGIGVLLLINMIRGGKK